MCRPGYAGQTHASERRAAIHALIADRQASKRAPHLHGHRQTSPRPVPREHSRWTRATSPPGTPSRFSSAPTALRQTGDLKKGTSTARSGGSTPGRRAGRECLGRRLPLCNPLGVVKRLSMDRVRLSLGSSWTTSSARGVHAASSGEFGAARGAPAERSGSYAAASALFAL